MEAPLPCCPASGFGGDYAKIAGRNANAAHAAKTHHHLAEARTTPISTAPGRRCTRRSTAIDLDVIEGADPRRHRRRLSAQHRKPDPSAARPFPPVRRRRHGAPDRFPTRPGLLSQPLRAHALLPGRAGGGRLAVGRARRRPGVSKRPGFGAHGALKDASSTDVVVHAGKALSTFYQCGEGYRLDPETLEQGGVAGWVPLDGISAHAKVDEHTGELMFFNYSKHAPYMHYGVVDAANKLAITSRCRCPARACRTTWRSPTNYFDPERPADVLGCRTAEAEHPCRAHASGLPSRFAIIPRHGDGEDSLVRGRAHLSCCIGSTPMKRATRSSSTAISRSNRCRSQGRGAPEATDIMMAYLDEHSFRSQAAPLALQPEDRRDPRGASRRAHPGIRHDQPALRRPEIPLCLSHHVQARLVPVHRLRQTRP